MSPHGVSLSVGVGLCACCLTAHQYLQAHGFEESWARECVEGLYVVPRILLSEANQFLLATRRSRRTDNEPQQTKEQNKKQSINPSGRIQETTITCVVKPWQTYYHPFLLMRRTTSRKKMSKNVARTRNQRRKSPRLSLKITTTTTMTTMKSRK